MSKEFANWIFESQRLADGTLDTNGLFYQVGMHCYCGQLDAMLASCFDVNRKM